MPHVILVTGLEDSGKNMVIDMVLKGSCNSITDYEQINFDKIGLKQIKNAITESEIRFAIKEFGRSLEAAVSVALKSSKSAIVDGPLVIKTDLGYTPIVTETLFEAISPDLIILFEAVNAAGKKIDTENQEMIKAVAESHCAKTGAPLKIIQIGNGKVKDALKQSRSAILSMIGK